MNVLLFAVLFGNLISVVPGRSVVPLPGNSSRVEILIRNVSERELVDVRLHAESKHCTFRTPEVISQVRPSDRASFILTLIRTPRTQRRRFPIQLRISSQHHPALSTFQLVGDGRKVSENSQGWIDVGVVKVGGRERSTRTLVFALLGVVPVALLLGLGWYLKKRARTG
jgi:hypothetical protein